MIEDPIVSFWQVLGLASIVPMGFLVGKLVFTYLVDPPEPVGNLEAP